MRRQFPPGYNCAPPFLLEFPKHSLHLECLTGSIHQSACGAAFSPDGKYVLTSGIDATARLWNVQTGEEIRRLAGHRSEVRDVSFSPDGKYVLTASNDGTARLWLTNLGDTIRAVCTFLTRDLTPDERLQFDIPNQDSTCPAQ